MLYVTLKESREPFGKKERGTDLLGIQKAFRFTRKLIGQTFPLKESTDLNRTPVHSLSITRESMYGTFPLKETKRLESTPVRGTKHLAILESVPRKQYNRIPRQLPSMAVRKGETYRSRAYKESTEALLEIGQIGGRIVLGIILACPTQCLSAEKSKTEYPDGLEPRQV